MLSSANEKLICPTCGVKFERKASHQIYCKREHYLKALRDKSKISQFPNYKCPSCGSVSQLDFYPKKSPQKWSEFICPGCNSYKENDDYFLIREIKDTMEE